MALLRQFVLPKFSPGRRNETKGKGGGVANRKEITVLALEEVFSSGRCYRLTCTTMSTQYSIYSSYEAYSGVTNPLFIVTPLASLGMLNVVPMLH